ncbi:hypothetical protein ACJX0J_017060, partial [Zea mays]
NNNIDRFESCLFIMSSINFGQDRLKKVRDGGGRKVFRYIFVVYLFRDVNLMGFDRIKNPISLFSLPFTYVVDIIIVSLVISFVFELEVDMNPADWEAGIMVDWELRGRRVNGGLDVCIVIWSDVFAKCTAGIGLALNGFAEDAIAFIVVFT